MPQKEQSTAKEGSTLSQNVVLVVEKDGQNLRTLIVALGADLKNIGADMILSSVMRLEEDLDEKINNLNQRLTAVGSRKQKHSQHPIPAQQKKQIVDALKNELGSLAQRRRTANEAFNAIYGTSQGDAGPARSVVVRRRESEFSVSVNPYEERQWWSFMKTPQGTEAWTLYSWDKDLFVMLHDGFVLKVNMNKARFESESVRAAATGAYQEFAEKVEGLRPGAQQALSLHLRSAMEFISRIPY